MKGQNAAKDSSPVPLKAEPEEKPVEEVKKEEVQTEEPRLRRSQRKGGSPGGLSRDGRISVTFC